MFGVSPSSRRGFSLLEVIVAMGLISMLGLLIIQVVIPSFRSTAETQKRISLQQKAMLLFRRLGNDVQDSSPAAISISSSPAVIAGQPISEFTPEASQLYTVGLWAYYQVGDEVRRVDWTPPGPPAISVTLQTTAPTRLTPADLAAFTTATIPLARTLTDQVRSLQLTHAGVGTAVAGPLTVEVVLGPPGPNDPARVQMRRVYSPRLGE